MLMLSTSLQISFSQEPPQEMSGAPIPRPEPPQEISSESPILPSREPPQEMSGTPISPPELPPEEAEGGNLISQRLPQQELEQTSIPREDPAKERLGEAPAIPSPSQAWGKASIELIPELLAAIENAKGTHPGSVDVSSEVSSKQQKATWTEIPTTPIDPKNMIIARPFPNRFGWISFSPLRKAESPKDKRKYNDADSSSANVSESSTSTTTTVDGPISHSESSSTSHQMPPESILPSDPDEMLNATMQADAEFYGSLDEGQRRVVEEAIWPTEETGSLTEMSTSVLLDKAGGKLEKLGDESLEQGLEDEEVDR